MKKLKLLMIMSMILSSVAVSSDLSKCVEVQQYYKTQVTSCEKARINLEQENKYLHKQLDNKADYLFRIPFTKIGLKTSTARGFIVGVVVGAVIL